MDMNVEDDAALIVIRVATKPDTQPSEIRFYVDRDYDCTFVSGLTELWTYVSAGKHILGFILVNDEAVRVYIKFNAPPKSEVFVQLTRDLSEMEVEIFPVVKELKLKCVVQQPILEELIEKMSRRRESSVAELGSIEREVNTKQWPVFLGFVLFGIGLSTIFYFAGFGLIGAGWALLGPFVGIYYCHKWIGEDLKTRRTNLHGEIWNSEYYLETARRRIGQLSALPPRDSSAAALENTNESRGTTNTSKG